MRCNSLNIIPHDFPNSQLIVKEEKEKCLDNLAEEIYSHIKFAKNGQLEPKRNLYAIFSDILDLDLSINKRYISKTSEKLARIYQSSFPVDKENLYPLGTEKDKLSQELVAILKNEINPLFIKIEKIDNIVKLREKFNKDIIKKKRLSLN